MNIAKLINFFFLICLAPVLGLAQGFTENVISDASFRGFSVYAADIDWEAPKTSIANHVLCEALG